MIKLYVEGYCQNCPDFEPEVEKLEHDSYSVEYNEHVCCCETVITCKYRDRCRQQIQYLKNERRRENNKDHG
jgi:hypothetical protein